MNPCCATNVLILFTKDDSFAAFAHFTHGSNSLPPLCGCTPNIFGGSHAGDALLDRVDRALTRDVTNLVARRLRHAMTLLAYHRHSPETLTVFKDLGDQDMRVFRNLLPAKIESSTTIFKPNPVAPEIMRHGLYIEFESEQLAKPS